MQISIRKHLLIMLVFLATMFICAAGVGSGTSSLVDGTHAGTPDTTHKPPKKTPRPKDPQVDQIFPTSSYIPSTSGFNFILGRPTDSSIAINFFSTSDRQITIGYGVSTGQMSKQSGLVSLKANIPQNLDITGLTPDTAYYYIVSGDGLPAMEHTFHTQRAPGSGFTFTIDADPHNRDPRFNGELYTKTLTDIENDHPDFHINLGDTFMTEKLKSQTAIDVESTFRDMRPFFGVSGADVPLFLVTGNHEGELGWLLSGKEKDLALWSTQFHRLYYPNPVPGGFFSGSTLPDASDGKIRDTYYAWKWGDALFIVLDPFWYTTSKPTSGDLNSNWNWTLGKEQYDWLKSTLETSQSRYKFVFIHHLVGGSSDARGGIEFANLFEWGGKNADGSDGFDEHRPGWGKPIHQLLVDNHVSAVFHGHDHVYVKQELDGIIYQEVPQPSVVESNKNLATEYGYKNGIEKEGSGYLRVNVTVDKTTVDFVREELDKKNSSPGSSIEIEDSYTIQ